MYSRLVKNTAIFIFVGFITLICVFIIDADTALIAAPIAATLSIAFFFWQTLCHRRGEIPLADAGTLTVLATAFYTVIPPLQFWLSGMQHTTLSAWQLYILAPSPREFAALTWWYVVYLLCFVLGYLVFDTKTKRSTVIPRPPDQATIMSLLLLFMILSGTMFAIRSFYGIDLYGVYDIEKMYVAYETLLNMPLAFRQFYGIIGHNGVLLIIKLAILIIVFLNWKKNVYRLSFYVWIFTLVVSNILWMGARTDFVLMSIASAILYHRFVKPLKPVPILLGGTGLLVLFLMIGLMRGSANIDTNLENFSDIRQSSQTIFSTSNEFDALFGGNYDLLQMKQTGILGEVPLQFRLYDLVMLIPQQILPYEKLDVQEWYVSRSHIPGFFMFNPISQSIIGFGWVELIFRGLFLGFLFAKLRAWYVRRDSSFWPTLLYFYLVIISYYTIRGTALYMLFASVLFRFIPLYLIVRLLANRKRPQVNNLLLPLAPRR